MKGLSRRNPERKLVEDVVDIINKSNERVEANKKAKDFPLSLQEQAGKEAEWIRKLAEDFPMNLQVINVNGLETK